jgi:integrase
MAKHPGIESRKDKAGKTRYRGVVNMKATGRRSGPWTTSLAEARSWRSKALGEAEAGPVPNGSTAVGEAWKQFIDAAEAGTIDHRSGEPYKPATLRGYKRCWARLVKAGLDDSRKLTEVRRADLQAIVDKLRADGSAASTVRNTFDPLRAIYRRAVRRDHVRVNPCDGLEFPKVTNARMDVRSPADAAKLIAAVPEGDRALWGVAFYAGLRRGEIRALRWSDIDLKANIISVTRTWDDEAGEQTPKSAAGVRKVPIIRQLRTLLPAAGQPDDLVFPANGDPSKPFDPSSVSFRADKAWKAASLERIILHSCRHTFARFMIASGANLKALSVVMGHASIGITLDTYGHMLPGSEDEVGRLLAQFLNGGAS